MFRNRPVYFVLGCLLCLVLVGIPIMVIWYLTCLCTRLTVTNQRTTLRHGLLSKHTNEVWHRDVRNVQIDQSFFQRIFGVGRIAISSSGQGQRDSRPGGG